jgi:3-oxoacyl-[acyl-carrier protein] reductase
MNFSSKTIVITGASSGIGKATAAVFLQHGGRVVATSERSQELAEAARELGEFGEVIPIHCDVASTGEVESLAARVEDLGGADVLVNNAGIWNEREFMDIDLEMWERVLRVNLTGAFICSRAFVPQMRAKGGGAIVNTASTNGLVAEPRLAHYNASKGGLVMLTLSMSIDLAKDNIRVNAVAP